MYVTVWEFFVRPSAEVQFERAYGPQGNWVRLFRSSAGYQGTELLKDSARTSSDLAGYLTRYITIDRWISEQSLVDFRLAFGEEYERLDAQCENITEQEKQIGAFAAVN